MSAVCWSNLGLLFLLVPKNEEVFRNDRDEEDSEIIKEQQNIKQEIDCILLDLN